MSVFYINGSEGSSNPYRYNSFFDPDTIPQYLLDALWEKKKSNDRYIYSKYVESSKKPNEINEPTTSNPNINLIISSDITKAIPWKGYNS